MVRDDERTSVVGVNDRLEWAAGQVDLRLKPLGRRHAHVLAVAQLAREIGATIVGEHSETLLLAALLHDIGYAPEVASSGFHPLDGARFVRDQGEPDIASLVAHHTGARHEAKLRGLHELEDEFPFHDSLLQRALTYCDLTTGPDGQRTNVADRVAEIVARYGGDHVRSRAAALALPESLDIEAEIEGLFSGSRESSRSSNR